MGNLAVSGIVTRGFEAVREASVENFERRNELGAACCVYYCGEKVVDLWGGIRNKAAGEPWEEDTMVLLFSTTKGLAAMAMALAHSRGWLNYEERVCVYWPEFAQQGKDQVTVRQLLAHQAGLFILDERPTMDDLRIGTYTELPFPAIRILVSDTVRVGMARRRIPVLLEVDVTDARAAIETREAAGEDLSFTGWIMKGLAQAVSEHPRVHALRRGRHRIVLFEDVDVGYMVRRQPDATGRSPDAPMPCLIRKVNEKSVESITAEIRAAQGKGPAPLHSPTEPPAWVPSRQVMRIFAFLPFFVRKALYWDRLLGDPFRMKRQMRTVAVTAVGMFADVRSGSGWGIPIEFHVFGH